MNQLIKELMLECGYACPEMAERSQKLALRVATECILLSTLSYTVYDGADNIRKAFYEPTKTKET